MNINIKELKEITDTLFSYLDEMNVQEIKCEEDYYWIIPKEKRYDSYEEPDKFTIGQLSENWTFLAKMVEEKRVVGPSFTWLASIFQILGEKAL